MRKALVLGGNGVFGSCLVAGLLRSTDLSIVVASRSGRPSASTDERVTAAKLDTATLSAEELRQLGVDLVADAAGPFQGASYRVAKAAIDAGCHYVDLADSRAFVGGFAVLDSAAKAAGTVALTGASSTPALSNAVIDEITRGWRQIETIEIGISPANQTPRGLSAVRSVLSFSGKPVRVFVDGNWQERAGWGQTVRREMGSLGRRWLALCETPDLDIVPSRHRVTKSAIFRGGLELTLLHLGLVAATVPVRLRLLPSLAPLASLFKRAADMLGNLGTDRGGMIVEAVGMDGEGTRVRALWTLVATDGDGRFVPGLPALAAIKAIGRGELKPGAAACVGLVPLRAIEEEFRPHRITTSVAVSEAVDR